MLLNDENYNYGSGLKIYASLYHILKTVWLKHFLLFFMHLLFETIIVL